MLATVARLSIVFLALVQAAVFPALVLADEFRLLPSIALRQEYNDNIFITEDQREHDFITIASPGLQLINKTERTDLSLLARMDQRWYWATSDLNDTDQYYSGSLLYRFTPRFSLTGRALHQRDSSPDRDIEVTGLVLGSTRRERNNFGLSGDYAFSEKTALNFSYDFSKDRYDDPAQSDLEAHSVNFGVIRDLSNWIRGTKGRFNLGYDRYDFTGTRIDNYSGTTGFLYTFSEKWSLLTDLGARYTSSRFDVFRLRALNPFFFTIAQETERDKGWGGVAQITFSYTTDVTTASLAMSHDIMPASGTAGSTERTGVSMSLSRRFTYELRGNFSTSFFLNKSTAGEFSAQKTDQQTLNVTPGMRYEFTKDIWVDGSYTYTRVKDKAAETTADRSLLMLRLTYQYPMFE